MGLYIFNRPGQEEDTRDPGPRERVRAIHGDNDPTTYILIADTPEEAILDAVDLLGGPYPETVEEARGRLEALGIDPDPISATCDRCGLTVTDIGGRHNCAPEQAKAPGKLRAAAGTAPGLLERLADFLMAIVLGAAGLVVRVYDRLRGQA